MKEGEIAMDQKTYLGVTAIIFIIISVLHLTRIFTGWEGSIGGWMVPQWISWVAFVVSGFLAYSGFNLSKRG